MFILIDPNNVSKPLDLSGVMKSFRPVKEAQETEAFHKHLEEAQDHDQVFHSALNSYRQASIKKVKKIFYAEDIMSKDVTTISSEDTLQDALSLFEDKRYRHVPIIKDGRVINLISDRDILKIQIKRSQSPDSAIDHSILEYVPPKDLLCAREKTAIRKISLLMLQKNIGCVPILNKEEQLIGMVTRSDILRAIVQFGPIDLWV